MSFMHSVGSQSRTPSAAFFLDLVLQQVRSHASPAEERGFLIQVGRAMAERLRIEGSYDLAALEGRINEMWRAMDLGFLSIAVIDDALLIRHQLPAVRDDDTGVEWQAALPHILQGAYDAWLRALGSSPRMQTTEASRTPDMIEFRHGA